MVGWLKFEGNKVLIIYYQSLQAKFSCSFQVVRRNKRIGKVTNIVGWITAPRISRNGTPSSKNFSSLGRTREERQASFRGMCIRWSEILAHPNLLYFIILVSKVLFIWIRLARYTGVPVHPRWKQDRKTERLHGSEVTHTWARNQPRWMPLATTQE